mgnify:CR=1 FL=1
MGGSAIGGMLLKEYLSDEINIPFITIRNFDIPKFVGKETLFFASSYSGTTEETIKTYKKAKQTGAKIISITSNGKLKEITEKDGTPTITIPTGFPPRSALGYLFTIPLLMLVKIGIIKSKSKQIKETINILKTKSKEYSELDDPEKNPALILANKLFNKLPVIYSAEQFFYDPFVFPYDVLDDISAPYSFGQDVVGVGLDFQLLGDATRKDLGESAARFDSTVGYILYG